MSDNNKEIRYHIEIPGISGKRISIDHLKTIAELTQKALRELATDIIDPGLSRERRFPRKVEKLIQLDLVGFEDGSATPVFGLREGEPSNNQANALISMDAELSLQEKVVANFKKDIEILNNDSDDWKTAVPRRAWKPFKDILSLPSKINSSSFDIAVGNGKKEREWIAVKKEAYKKIEEKLEERGAEDIVCLGTIREIDEKDRTAELYDPSGKTIKVTFNDNLFEDIDAARWQPVHIVGKGTIDPRSGLVSEIEAKKIIPQDTEQEIFWSKEIIEEGNQASGIIDYDAIEPFSEKFDFEGFMKAIEEA